MKANALSEEEIIEHANDKCHVVTRMVNQGHYWCDLGETS